MVLIGTSLASNRHMTTANLTTTDIRLRDAVMRQLAWDPEVDASAVGVSATKGTVTLTGYIDTYAGKLAAERAAKRVVGVRAVANDIDVRLRLERTDTDIAQDAARALRLLSALPEGVQAAVHNGRVTLTGTCNGCFRRRAPNRPCVTFTAYETSSAISMSCPDPWHATSAIESSEPYMRTPTWMRVTST